MEDSRLLDYREAVAGNINREALAVKSGIGHSTLPDVHDISVRDGAFLHRETGHHLFLRGICFGPSAKQTPFLPFRAPEDFARFESYLDLLLACGFYVLRLPFFWSALEPTCDVDSPQYDTAYADRYFEYVQRLTQKGFVVFIDLHQDLLGAQFGGNGLPSWVHEDGSRSGVLLSGTPLWGLNYVMNRGLRKTLTAFWRNDLTNTTANPPLRNFKVRDRFLDAIEFLAERSSHNPRIVGIEIFNEPHYATLAEDHFEREILAEFYAEATRRIRQHSEDLFVFVSPQSDWNVNLRPDKDYRSHLPHARDERTVFAFHYYDSQLTALYGSFFHDNKREEYVASIRLGSREALEKHMVPFLTEFGTRQNWNSAVARKHMNWHFQAVEHTLLNSTYWNVNLYNTKWHRDGFMREDFSLLGPAGVNGELTPRNLDMACRPYIISSPVRPVVSEFSPTSKRFEFVIEATDMTEPIDIYLPAEKLHPMQPVHYPEGFRVEYAGEYHTQFADNRLKIWLDPHKSYHLVTIVA